MRYLDAAKVVLELTVLDLKMKAKRALAFRLNFAINLLISLFYSLIFSTFQFFVYTGIKGYPGWSVEQMLLFQATLLFWTGITDFLFGGVKQLIDVEVVYGNLDRFFVWPPHTLISLFTRGTNIYALSSILAGLTGITTMLVRLHWVPGLRAIAAFALFFVSGLIFYAALLIFYCGCTLFMVKMERLREVLDRVVFFGSFPADAYFGPGKAAFISLFPIALWVYLPTRALLGRVEPFAFSAVVMTAGFFFAALRFWRHQERKYTSAGG